MEVAVGPELRAQIADRQSARAAGGEQIVVRKPDHVVFVVEGVGTAVEDRADQRHDVGLGNLAAQSLEQDRVVDRGKVLADIGAQHVRVLPREVLAALDGAMGALAEAVGVAVRNEDPFESCFDGGAKGVMDDTVAKAGSADAAALGLVDHEMGVGPRPVFAEQQLALQLEQAVGMPVVEGRHRGAAAFAARRALEGAQQACPTAHILESRTMQGRGQWHRSCS